MLLVTNDGRKIALDVRLFDDALPDEAGSKSSVASEHIYEIWERTADRKGAQLVFCDLSTPKSDKTFNVYDDLKHKLIRKGIPEREIQFIHDAASDMQKETLYSRVRNGTVRVLLGSTAKLGSGTNVQQRLYALHHVDVPWRPSDLEQREGRILRQGNSWPEVEVKRYIKERSFDSYSYQIIENKQRFISLIMTNKPPARRYDDVDTMVLEMGTAKALASGNPKIKEKLDIEMEITRLQTLKNQHNASQYRLQDKVLKSLPKAIRENRERIAALEKDLETCKNYESSEFSIQIGEKTYTERKDAGQAILDRFPQIEAQSPEYVTIGKFKNFAIAICFSEFYKNYSLKLVGEAEHKHHELLSKSDIGIVTRIENTLKDIQGTISCLKEQITSDEKEIELSKPELGVPFAYEKELEELIARDAALTVELDLGTKQTPIVLDEPAEEPDIEAVDVEYEEISDEEEELTEEEIDGFYAGSWDEMDSNEPECAERC